MPSTEAGRTLSRRMDGTETWMTGAIEAVEAESVAAYRTRLAERVEAEHAAIRVHFGAGPDEHVGLPLDAVLALIREETPAIGLPLDIDELATVLCHRDPAAYGALLTALRRYGPDFAPLVERFGQDGGTKIMAGTLLSYLADQWSVFIRTEDAGASGYRPGMAFGTGGNQLPRSADAALLDVGRLARAYHLADHPAVPDCRLSEGSSEPGRRYCEWKAEQIARAYLEGVA